MQIFKFCPHCGKKLFLIFELELSSLFGKDEFERHKDEAMRDKETERFPVDYEGEERAIRQPGGYDELPPKGYPVRHKVDDWNAFNTFLHLLQVSHGPRLHVSYEEKDFAKLRELEIDQQKVLTTWMEQKEQDKYWKAHRAAQAAKEESRRKEQSDKLYNDHKDWFAGIGEGFGDKIKREWTNSGLGYDIVKNLVEGYGFKESDFMFARWLKEVKKMELPNGLAGQNIADLRLEYKNRVKEDPKSKEPPPSSQKERDTLINWFFRGHLTQDDYNKMMYSNLCFIWGNSSYQFTIDEAKAELMKATPFTAPGSTPVGDPEIISFELKQGSIIYPRDNIKLEGGTYLVIYTQKFKNDGRDIEEIYCRGDDQERKEKNDFIKTATDEDDNPATKFILTTRLIKAGSEGPDNWKNGTALLFEADDAYLRVKPKVEEVKRTDWGNMLREINTFFSIRRSIDEINTFLSNKNDWAEPMEGVLLAGHPKDQLVKRAIDHTAHGELKGAKGRALIFNPDIGDGEKKYRPLLSSPDGNCFFNAFSILLYGNEGLASRLRLALCLNIMKQNFTGTKDNVWDEAEINNKLPKLSSVSSYEGWAEFQDISFISLLLKRPIRLVSHPGIVGTPGSHTYQELSSTGGFAWSPYVSRKRDSEQPIFVYREWFTIYHVGGCHFVPLVPSFEDKVSDEDLDIHPFILVNFFIVEIIYQPGSVHDISDPELQIKVLPKALGSGSSDVVLDEWISKPLKQITILGTGEQLRIEETKLKSNPGKQWSISGEMEINYREIDGLLTFTPGADLVVDIHTDKPASTNPAFQFYLTSYKKIASGMDNAGSIVMKFDEVRSSKSHFKNYPLGDPEKIRNGIWIFANQAGSFPDTYSTNTWHEIQGEFEMNTNYLVVRKIDGKIGFVGIEEQPNNVNWGSYGGLFRDFTEAITNEWKRISFDKEFTGRWLDAGIGYNEWKLANWINDVKNKDPIYARTNLGTLRTEFEVREHNIKLVCLCNNPWNAYLRSARGMEIYKGDALTDRIGDDRIDNYAFIKFSGGYEYQGIIKNDPTGVLFIKNNCKGIRCIETGRVDGDRTLDWTTDWNSSIDYLNAEDTRTDIEHLYNIELELNIFRGSKVRWIKWLEPFATPSAIQKNALLLIEGDFRIIYKKPVGVSF